VTNAHLKSDSKKKSQHLLVGLAHENGFSQQQSCAHPLEKSVPNTI
jgi:hypothetical protein